MKDGTPVTRRLWVIIASAGFLAAPDAMAQSLAQPAALQWAVPTTLPTSALVAVASGDPTRPGESTFLISMPNGYRIPPHFHPSHVQVEVREGTLLVGMGDKLDAKLRPGAGSRGFGHHPGGDAPFLDRQRANRRVPGVHWPLYDHLPPRGGRAAATGFPHRLLRGKAEPAARRLGVSPAEPSSSPPSSPPPAVWPDPWSARLSSPRPTCSPRSGAALPTAPASRALAETQRSDLRA